MLTLSLRRITGVIIFCFVALLGVRHAFSIWQQYGTDQAGFYFEEQFDGFLPILRWVDRVDYDLHLRNHRIGAPNPGVAVIEVNERSIQEIGQFPFARNVYADLITNLEEIGAKAVAFDMAFSESERNESLAELRKLRIQVANAENQDSEIVRTLDTRIRALNSDEILATKIRDSSLPVILGFSFVSQDVKAKEARDISDEQKRLLQQHAIRTAQINQRAFASQMSAQIPVLGNIELLPSLPKSSLGHFLPRPDSDSVIRRVPLVIEYNGGFFISLAAQAVARSTKSEFTFRREGGLWLDDDSGKFRIPVNNTGDTLARYYGAERTFPYVEFVDAIKVKDLEKTDPARAEMIKSRLKGKIVFIGATAEGLRDIRANPLSERYPGVEVHATIASNILNGEYMVRDNRYFYFGYLTLIIAGVLIAWLVHRFHPAMSVAYAVGLAVAVQLLARYAFFNQGVVVPTIYPTVEIFFLVFTGILFRYFTEEKEKKFVRTAFSRYVSGAVVDQLLKDQSKLQLGGQKKELTVMFSDLAGFTKISEKLDAGFVTQLLNEYFTRMTRVILANQGTLDKYMGDGIMCFWGAPLDIPDHAALACQAAHEMTIELRKLNEEWKVKHDLNVHMRIGVHSGDMAVGNMGSETVFSYTVMGDNVNLGSRLEGVNTVYGTMVLVSEDTAERAKGRFVFRPLDLVQVKGKEEAVQVYELVGPATEQQQHAEWLHAFEAGLASYRAGKWEEAEGAFGTVLALRPGDKPAQIFIERVRQLAQARPTQWDGVWKLSTK